MVAQSSPTTQPHDDVESLRFAFKGGFKVDGTNQQDFLDNPPTSSELSAMYGIVAKRDYAEWLTFKLLLGVFFVITFFTIPSNVLSLLAANGVESSLFDASIMIIVCLVFNGFLAHFLAGVLAGLYFPVGITIDGVTYLSHLSDVEPVSGQDASDVDNCELTDTGCQYLIKVGRLGRPFAKFETYLIPELGKVCEDYDQR